MERMAKGWPAPFHSNALFQTYGDVFTFWLGPLPTVNICDYQLAQEAMVKNGSNFVDRLYIYIVNVVRGKWRGD